MMVPILNGQSEDQHITRASPQEFSNLLRKESKPRAAALGNAMHAVQNSMLGKKD
jgi:hypothetical protein